jgi:F-type H+-transporting ATPase subunit delta
MIRAASRHAMVDLRGQLDRTCGPMSVDELTTLANELYAVAELLVSEPRLRRTVGDPSTAPESRAALVGALLQPRVGAAGLEVAQEASRLRWSSPWDLADGLELSGDDALMRAAEQQDVLDDVEDELFRFERILSAEDRLTTLLDDVGIPAERRVSLLRDVLAGKVQPATAALLEHAARSTRKRSILLALSDLLEATAARRDRSVARVVSAVPVTAEQEARLAQVLSGMYGREIEVRSSIDAAVQGGLVIRVGDEVIDGTVTSRFAAARAALAR